MLKLADETGKQKKQEILDMYDCLQALVECIPDSTEYENFKVSACEWDAKVFENARRVGLHPTNPRVHPNSTKSEKFVCCGRL